MLDWVFWRDRIAARGILDEENNVTYPISGLGSVDSTWVLHDM